MVILLLLTTGVATTEINSVNTIVTYTMVIKGQYSNIYPLTHTVLYSIHLFEEIFTGNQIEKSKTNLSQNFNIGLRKKQ